MLVVLSVLGVVLEVVGFALAAVGFVRTWRQNAPGLDFWRPEKARASSTWARVVAAGRRLAFWRRVDVRPQTADLGTAIDTESAMPITVRRSRWQSTSDVQEALAVIRATIDHLEDNVRAHVTAEGDARAAGDAAVEKRLREELAAVATAAQRVAVGGLRLQLAGWLLLMVGVLIQGGVNIAQLL